MNLVKTLFPAKPRVLNVGSGPSYAKLSPRYDGMRQYKLDIDPRLNPDVCCDALEMSTHIKPNSFEAVFCHHNLEHYYYHHVKVVLSGMFYVLKPNGWVEIVVPDIFAAIDEMNKRKAGPEDVLYVSPGGPISTIDIIYGWRLEIERSNQPYFAHKTCFTPQTLHDTLTRAGFVNLEIYKCPESFELQGIGYKP